MLIVQSKMMIKLINITEATMTILFLNQIITPKLSDKIARIMNDSTIENIGFYKIFTDGIWYCLGFHSWTFIVEDFRVDLESASRDPNLIPE